MPICVPTFVPTSVTIRHLVLDPITVRNPILPFFTTVRHIVLEPILNFVTIRHLVLKLMFIQIVPIVVPFFCLHHLVHFAVCHHRLTTRTSSAHLTSRCQRCCDEGTMRKFESLVLNFSDAHGVRLFDGSLCLALHLTPGALQFLGWKPWSS